jgi:hypothetical protein
VQITQILLRKKTLLGNKIIASSSQRRSPESMEQCLQTMSL